MREIQASEAKAHLPQLLDDVERGETLIITRHGRAIARIVPEVDRRQEEVERGRIVSRVEEPRSRDGQGADGEKAPTPVRDQLRRRLRHRRGQESRSSQSDAKTTGKIVWTSPGKARRMWTFAARAAA